MSVRRQTCLVVLGVCLLAIVGGGLLVWPPYRETREINDRIASLHAKISGLSGTNEHVETLAADLAALRKRADRDLRTIPETADLADLIRRLSLPVDDATVLDQTFTAGSTGPAIAGDEHRTEAMPLTVDMVASFDSVFALLESAESMQRLVRISSFRMHCDRDKLDDPEFPFVTASIALDAIYEPSRSSEGN